jgi:hypothetical protein
MAWRVAWSKRTQAQGFVLMGLLVLAVSGVALAWDVWKDTHAPVAWAVGAVAVITFFGSLIILGINSKARIRTSITIAFVATYFVLLGLVAFLSQPAGGEADGQTQTPEVTNTLVTNFTVLMGVVVAFYFGATAYETVARINAVAANPRAADEIEEAAEGEDI